MALQPMPVDFYDKPSGLPSGLVAYPVWGTCPV